MEVHEGRKGIPCLLSSQGECIASNITQLIGWTPLIELKNIAKKDGIDARLIGKIEPYQPLSSVKDRNASLNGFKGLLDRVEQLKEEKKNVFVVDQFTNLANPDAHFRWTGPEIWKDTEGKVDIFVAGSGSGGTLTGTGRFLKTKNPSVKIICVEPAESVVISGGEPVFHNIQGIGPGFIPGTLDTSQIDEIITVTTQEAMDMARRLAREEGLLVGISSGANVAAREENKGKMIVTIFSSGGERYLNSELCAQVKEECVEMNISEYSA
ncbi:hypothetical protein PR202_gb06643 [Eleusine coracana subsp. coracana]|uniref:Tryptophan synthase beta chain-like PALP domain-containing protein n=1 Tax=Eleusine coracana subsp. coracana TaxID=191504 RepID=A0AAV5E9X9_ELECO|nr:hypothetical protein PR202_gb06643 [Eleusine coracana subsp. coracana]